VLLRRLADAQLASGRPDLALQTLEPASEGVANESVTSSKAVTEAMSALRPRAAADDGLALSPQAAAVSLELTRAEALAHLVRREAAVAAFAKVEQSLQQLEGPVAPQLWIRWARAQTWFLCEILGDARAALNACERVRSHVSNDVLDDARIAIELLQAEEVASSSSGDFERARKLIDDQIALAERQRAPREECLAWNAKGLLHFAGGALSDAQTAFERALLLAQNTRWIRREAITTHNLALLAVEALRLEEARALEQRYDSLSKTIGNSAALAEAPLVFAAVELAAGAPDLAMHFIDESLAQAERGGWEMLVAQAHALTGKCHLWRAAEAESNEPLESALKHFLMTIETLERHSLAWSEELDPGETYALLAVTQLRLGRRDDAQQSLNRASSRVPVQSAAASHALALGQAYFENGPLEEALAWFSQRGYRRLCSFWSRLKQSPR
jgi:tetratricopeptide (TPR) repeat protein